MRGWVIAVVTPTDAVLVADFVGDDTSSSIRPLDTVIRTLLPPGFNVTELVSCGMFVGAVGRNGHFPKVTELRSLFLWVVTAAAVPRHKNRIKAKIRTAIIPSDRT